MSSSKIAKLERKLGCELPPEYREYLIAGNGGPVEVEGYEIPITLGTIKSLPGLVDDYRSSIGDETPLDADTGDAHEVIPIADDHHGNYVVLVVSGDSAGELKFFDHEMFELVHVADSLSQFLENPVL